MKGGQTIVKREEEGALEEERRALAWACPYLSFVHVSLGDVAHAPVEGDASSQAVEADHDERVQARESRVAGPCP